MFFLVGLSFASMKILMIIENIYKIFLWNKICIVNFKSIILNNVNIVNYRYLILINIVI